MFRLIKAVAMLSSTRALPAPPANSLFLSKRPTCKQAGGIRSTVQAASAGDRDNRNKKLRSSLKEIAKQEARYAKERVDDVVRSHKAFASSVKNAPQEFRAILEDLKNIWAEIRDSDEAGDCFEDGESPVKKPGVGAKKDSEAGL